MRILTLLAGPDAVPDAHRLWAEIRAFNRTIDFRLRFLHIDIEGALVAPSDVIESLGATEGLTVHAVTPKNPLAAAAAMAMLLDRERPALLIILGAGGLAAAGIAAAEAADTRVALFGDGRESHAAIEGAGDAMDLGDDAKLAVERVSGVTRELG